MATWAQRGYNPQATGLGNKNKGSNTIIPSHISTFMKLLHDSTLGPRLRDQPWVGSCRHSHTGPSAIRGYNPRATGPHQYGHTGPTTFGGYNPWAPGPGINPGQVHVNMAYRAHRQLGDSTLRHQATFNTDIQVHCRFEHVQGDALGPDE